MTSGLRWHGPGETLQVSEFRIQSPLCYSDTARKSSEPSAVTLHSAVVPPKDALTLKLNGVSFGSHHESYSRMGSQGRWHYLDWLQRGRPLPWDDDGLLLYLQGLERRIIVDRCDADLLWAEAWRLWQGCDESCYSFAYLAQRFLWYLLPHAAETVTQEQAELLSLTLYPISPWNTDSERYLSLWLCWCVRQSGELPAWAAYRCARLLDGARHSVVIQRAENDMRRLFETRFKDRWGEAVSLPLPAKARRRLDYAPVNFVLQPASVTWPDPMKLTSHWAPLANDLLDLYNGCQDDLRPLGLLLGKAGVTRKSPIAWETLPCELRTGENPAIPKLSELSGGSLERSGFAVVTAGEVGAIFSVPQRDNLSAEVSKRLAASVQTCGIGIEPDPRLMGRGYKWADPVVLFDPKEDGLPSEFEPGYIARYQACAFLLRSAFHVAQAGGEVDGAALSLIGNSIFDLFSGQSPTTEPAERRRFMAFATLLKVRGADWASVRVPSGWSAEAREGTGRLLLQLAQRDRCVSAAEEAALKAVWKRLGLDARSLSRGLDALSAEGVVFIGEMRQGRVGERIPRPTGEDAPVADFVLDKAAIATLLADTRHVQQALTEAMTVDEAMVLDEVGVVEELPSSEGTVPDSPHSGRETLLLKPSIPEMDRVLEEAPEQGCLPTPGAMLPVFQAGHMSNVTGSAVEDGMGHPNALEGLPSRYLPFATMLLARERWDISELKQLAGEQRVMLAGAIEVINDWAFEALGEQLLWEEGDGWAVERSLLEIRS